MPYPAPDFVLDSGRTGEEYERWVKGRAVAHRKRDLARGQKTGLAPPVLAVYERAIHAAVLRSGGTDEYTGDPLDWSIIGVWSNEDARARGAAYKREHRSKPTIDHIHGEDGRPLALDDLRICAWEMNDAKGDLSFAEFESLCRRVIETSARRLLRGTAARAPEGRAGSARDP